MSRLMFVYLSGSEKGKTRIFTQQSVSIGASDACDLTIVPEEGGVLPDGVIADVHDDDGAFHLAPREGMEHLEIRINGEELDPDPAAGYALNDGDTIHIGHGLSSASVLFQVMPENFTSASITRRGQKEPDQMQAQPVHPLTATLFVKELSASLWAEIPRKAKLFAVFSVLFLTTVFAALLYFTILFLHRTSSEISNLRTETQAEQLRRQQDQEIMQKQRAEIDRLRETSEQNRVFTQKIAELYSPGVCLVVGSYTFVERGTGRVLRYETVDDANEEPIDRNGNLLASVDGLGPPVQIDYTGTGFLVEEGVIATNKHVMKPWENDQRAQIIMQQGNGFRPRFELFEAFFPSIQTPFPLKDLSASDRYDVALCKFDQGDAALPVLSMSTDDPRSIIGQPIVLLGYPTGVDGLIQRIDESEQREILKQAGQSADAVAAALARRGLIRPLTTTGTISDALPGRIVHSAQTTEGGSGSPMIDRDGTVIAINSAILTTLDGSQSFGGSNFGVPIKAAYDLLRAYHIADKSDAKAP
ncbi:MAG TPA: trypsin-like peptidase domain-containing protein [Blastocatellia bacterium]|nr:trypsin-like peptidase domain-containing protein [Blastocatellia bacterium]